MAKRKYQGKTPENNTGNENEVIENDVVNEENPAEEGTETPEVKEDNASEETDASTNENSEETPVENDDVDDSETPEEDLPENDADEETPSEDDKAEITAPTFVDTEVITLDKVAGVINNKELTFEDKVKLLSTNGTPDIKQIVAQLEDHVAVMSKNVIDEKLGLSKQVSLFKRLKRLVLNNDPAMFKSLFNIVNFYFREHKDGVFDPFRAHRFIHAWKDDKASYQAFSFLLTILTSLCTYGEREKALKAIDFKVGTDYDTTGLGQLALDNLSGYYEV